MGSNGTNPRSKRPTFPSFLNRILTILLLSLLVISPLTLIFLFLSPPSTSSSLPHASTTSKFKSFSGDLRDVEFSWNSLPLRFDRPPPISLKIAVFSRKWPVLSAPGGMERHALTLHSVLARRGHRIHVFTSPPPANENFVSSEEFKIRFKGPPGQWNCGHAWDLYKTENSIEPFDVVHSESVSMYHRFAKLVPNLAVSWHGIALEALHSKIYQDQIRPSNEPMTPSFNNTLATAIFKVTEEIRFFKSYAYQIATSDSSGEMLRDVYQVPERRVHVILNGVDENKFGLDVKLGEAFMTEIGIPEDAAIVMGIAGRLVKDKGHPLVYAAFSKLITTHPKVYLVIAGKGPWEQRYIDLGPNVIALGALPPSRLKAFYNSIDVFVHPTLRPQGLDQTLIEAMLCGTPIMATRLPSIKGSLIVDKEFGFMFPPNVDALSQVMEEAVAEGRMRLKERGSKCREYAGTMLTARKMAMAYERLFLCIKNEAYCAYPLNFD